MASKSSRNDLCGCGSGKKYKNCHGRKGIRFNLKLLKRSIIIILILAAGAWGAKYYFLTDDTSEPSADVQLNQNARRVQPLAPQPPGPVPPGKVWSPEHGHWHNAITNTADGDSTAYYPKPAGLPPPGKVWSYEHGHWHDSTYKGTENFKPGPPPPGPAPAGKVWSYEHGHWHDAPKSPSQKVQVGTRSIDNGTPFIPADAKKEGP